MKNNPEINPVETVTAAYDFAQTIESISTDPATRVVAEINPKIINQASRNSVNSLVRFGYSSSELTQSALIAEHNLLFGNPTNRNEAQQRYLKAKAASAAISEKEDAAWVDYNKVDAVKDKQFKLARRFVASLVLTGTLIGGVGLGWLTAEAQTSVATSLNAQDKAEKLKLPEISTAPEIPVDSVVGGVGGLVGGEMGLVAGIILSPRAARRRANRIVKKSDKNHEF
jgi:hypothetical protein